MDESLLSDVDVNIDADLSAAENAGAHVDAEDTAWKESTHDLLNGLEVTEFEDTVPGAYVVTPANLEEDR